MISTFRSAATAAILVVSGLLSGCASDGPGPATTGSIAEPAKVDPACVSLAAQIDQMNKEGTPDRLAQAATGKTATVPVKRDALAKQAQLNKANAEYRSRCSTITPKPQQQAAVAAPPAAAGAGVAAAAPSAEQAAQAAAERAVARRAAPKTALEAARESTGPQ
jgi:hypothetical protein